MNELKYTLYSTGFCNRKLTINNKEILIANCYDEYSLDDLVEYIRSALELAGVEYNYIENKEKSIHDVI